MKLKTQLSIIAALAAAAVVVGTLILLALANEVHAIHARMEDARADVTAQFNLISSVQSYFGEQRELFFGGDDAEGVAQAYAGVVAAFTQLQDAEGSDTARPGEDSEEQRLEASHRMFDALVTALRELQAMPRTGSEAENEREELATELFEKGYERELMPSLIALVGSEQEQLANATADLDRRARLGRWLALSFGLVGIASVAVVSLFAARQASAGLEALTRGVAAMGRGELAQRIPALKTIELDELGKAFNSMASALGDATDSKARAEKLAAVGQLAASVGHEVRNPLSAARNALAYLTRVLPAAGAGENKRVRQFLELADRELAVCNKIIEDLLDFARERPLNFTACPLEPLLEEILEVVRKPEGTRISVSVPRGFPAFDADRDQIRQLIGNLVQNAVEAVPNTRQGSVSVRAEVVADMARIHVEDNGEGFAEEDRLRIFEPLVTTKSKGTGLGLAIVANIVKRHKGSIEAGGQPGVGAKFSVTLPLRQKGAQP